MPARASASWMVCPNGEMAVSGAGSRLRTLSDMPTTLLTKRRAVDHCRVRSALCRAS